jgi:hypothetical protein
MKFVGGVEAPSLAFFSGFLISLGVRFLGVQFQLDRAVDIFAVLPPLVVDITIDGHACLLVTYFVLWFFSFPGAFRSACRYILKRRMASPRMTIKTRKKNFPDKRISQYMVDVFLGFLLDVL